MVKKSGNWSLIRFLVLMGLVGSVFVPQGALLAEEGSGKSKARPVRWQPPTDVGSSGRRTGNPPRTVHGGSRDGCVNNGEIPLTALIPASYEGRVGVESPVIYVYFPYEAAPFYPVSFSLKTMVDGKEQVMVESFYRVKGEAGLLAIPLPESLPLERGLVYRWRFAVDCEGSAMDYVEGNLSLEPEEISSDLFARLAGATPLERAEVYLTEGWWYDAVKQLLILHGNGNSKEVEKLRLSLFSGEDLGDFKGF
jgi:hypothetical protein